MYIIEIPTQFAKADGKPFLKVKMSSDGKPVRAMDDKGNPISFNDDKGNQVSDYETTEANYIEMLTFFINNLFDLVAIKSRDNKEIKPLKSEDSAFALDVFRAIHAAKDIIVLERTAYEWVQRMLNNYGVDVFGVNQAVIIEPIKKATEKEASGATYVSK